MEKLLSHNRYNVVTLFLGSAVTAAAFEEFDGVELNVATLADGLDFRQRSELPEVDDFDILSYISDVSSSNLLAVRRKIPEVLLRTTLSSYGLRKRRY